MCKNAKNIECVLIINRHGTYINSYIQKYSKIIHLHNGYNYSKKKRTCQYYIYIHL